MGHYSKIWAAYGNLAYAYNYQDKPDSAMIAYEMGLATQAYEHPIFEWGRNILREDKYDHPNLTDTKNNELWKDYLIYCYDEEYFNTIYKCWMLKVKHLLDNTPNVKGYLFVNTVESYKKPDFVDEKNYLYTNSSITNMLLDKKEPTLFERGLDIQSRKNEEKFIKGRAHPSTKGYEIVANDIHDILYNT